MPDSGPASASLPALGDQGAVAIRLRDVHKIYRLYDSPLNQALDIMGLTRLLFWRRGSHFGEFPALDGLSLDIRQGERVGIVGRNGAGKTTFLKLITGNFAPTTGLVEVNGSVQALMQVGLGFHPEFSGYENIRSSLLYNGLAGDDYEAALSDVIDFVELDEFLHQPVKTYSAGMQARLQFACATAVKPDILIVDEILGAGDAYFSAKSALRMERLALSGCTLLLVSHSTPQVLQFCNRAVWVERGRMILDGDALAVVKAYEEFAQRLRTESENHAIDEKGPRVIESRWLTEHILASVVGEPASDKDPSGGERAEESSQRSAGGLSRWQGEGRLRIVDTRLRNSEGKPCYHVAHGEELSFEIEVEAEEKDSFTCTYALVIFTADGRCVSRHCSPVFEHVLDQKQRAQVYLKYNSVLLGNGKYVFSVGAYRVLDLQKLQNARYYDLLSRSFEFEVTSQDRGDQSLFHHPHEWLSEQEMTQNVDLSGLHL